MDALLQTMIRTRVVRLLDIEADITVAFLATAFPDSDKASRRGEIGETLPRPAKNHVRKVCPTGACTGDKVPFFTLRNDPKI